LEDRKVFKPLASDTDTLNINGDALVIANDTARLSISGDLEMYGTRPV